LFTNREGRGGRIFRERQCPVLVEDRGYRRSGILLTTLIFTLSLQQQQQPWHHYHLPARKENTSLRRCEPEPEAETSLGGDLRMMRWKMKRCNKLCGSKYSKNEYGF
jgi:hypothetical protein